MVVKHKKELTTKPLTKVKYVPKREDVVALNLRNMSRGLRDLFHKHCSRKGISMSDRIMQLMKMDIRGKKIGSEFDPLEVDRRLFDINTTRAVIRLKRKDEDEE
jgi:hypothetical protein